jgi:hypothetical protein
MALLLSRSKHAIVRSWRFGHDPSEAPGNRPAAVVDCARAGARSACSTACRARAAPSSFPALTHALLVRQEASANVLAMPTWRRAAAAGVRWACGPSVRDGHTPFSISVKDGVIAHLDNEGGHYAPPADYGYQMLHELKARGVKVTKNKVVFQGSRAQLRKLGQAPKVRLCPDASHLKTMKH